MIRSGLWFTWLVVTLVPYAVVLLLLAVFSRAAAYPVAKAWLGLVVWGARWIAGVQYRVQGMESLPAAGSLDPVILCPKHQSTWETFALPAMMSHPLAYVFKKELLMIPFFGWAIGALEMVHIDRSKHSEAWNKVAEQGQVLMAKGIWIIMFPEGTRTERGKQGKYKSGATRLAITTGAAVVPIAVSSAKCWPRRSFRLSPGIIDVSIAKPIPSTGREPDELMQEVET